MSDDVKIEIGRRAVKAGVTVAVVEEQIVPAAAFALAKAEKARVQDRGDLGGQVFPGWSSKGFVGISPRYPLKGAGHVGPSGAVFFPSNKAFHEAQGSQPGHYDTSGGMWAGLSTVVESTKKAVNAFRGRSEGQDPNFFRYKRPTKRNGGVLVKARGLLVNNSLKAATVLAQHGVNVLAVTDGELQGVAAGAVGAAALGIDGQLPVEWQGQRITGSTVAQIFAQALP